MLRLQLSFRPQGLSHELSPDKAIAKAIDTLVTNCSIILQLDCRKTLRVISGVRIMTESVAIKTFMTIKMQRRTLTEFSDE